MLRPSHALPQRSASELFTDREDARARFTRALDDPQALDAYRAITWYGVGGQGKSALQAEFGRMIERARGQWVNARGRRLASGLVDLENPANRNPAQALLSLRLQLAEHGGLKFPAFDLAFARYFGLDQPGKDIRATHPELFRQGSEVLGDVLGLAEDVANVIPGYAFLTKYGSKLVARGAEAMQTWWDRRGRTLLVGLDELSVDQLAAALPKYLGYDLCEAMTAERGPRVVIRFDTHEALWRDRGLKDGPGALLADDWLRRLVQDTPGAVVIITGRDKLRWGEIDADWDTVLEQHLLGGLSDEDAAAFLAKAGVGDEAVRARMITAAAGEPGEGCLPYYLDLERETHDAIVAGGAVPTPDQFGGGRAEILARFLAHLDPETERRLRLASYPETLDPESLAVLSKDFLKEPDTEGWKRFLSRAFVEQSEDGPPSLHRLTRATLQASEREDHWERFKQIHLWFWTGAEHRLSKPDQPVTADDEREFLTAINHMVALGSARSVQWATDRLQRFADAARSRTVEAAADRLMPFAEQYAGPLWVAALMAWQARAAADLGRAAQAEALFRDAVGAYEQHAGPDDDNTLACLANLADVIADQVRYDEAEALYDRVLAAQIRSLGLDHPQIAVTRNNLALLYQHQGRYAKAVDLLEKVLATVLAEHGPDHRRTATARSNLADLWVDIGAFDAAEPLAEAAVKTLGQTLGRDHPHYWYARVVAARIVRGRRRFDQAVPLYADVLAGLEAALGPDHPSTVRLRVAAARLTRDMGDAQTALDTFQTALDLVESGAYPHEAFRAYLLIDRAETDLALGQTARPAEDLARARIELAKVVSPDHPDWASLWLVEARLDAAEGRSDAARAKLAMAAQCLENAGVRPEAVTAFDVAEALAALGPA